MLYETTKIIAEHLEFLGYTVNLSEDEDDHWDVISTKKANKPSLHIRNNQVNNILLVTLFTIDPKGDSDGLLKLINEINFDSWITKWSYNGDDKDPYLAINAGMLGYDKIKFAYLIETYNLEIERYLKNLKKYY